MSFDFWDSWQMEEKEKHDELYKQATASHANLTAV